MACALQLHAGANTCRSMIVLVGEHKQQMACERTDAAEPACGPVVEAHCTHALTMQSVSAW